MIRLRLNDGANLRGQKVEFPSLLFSTQQKVEKINDYCPLKKPTPEICLAPSPPEGTELACSPARCGSSLPRPGLGFYFNSWILHHSKRSCQVGLVPEQNHLRRGRTAEAPLLSPFISPMREIRTQILDDLEQNREIFLLNLFLSIWDKIRNI